MKLEGFTGGNDVQRSLNLADNRCINLYPTVDDSGAVTAFYSTPGLLAYTTAASAFSGLYTASNGRCFATSGTTLYEVTTGGVLTSRGTVTSATTYKMSDNGIELILVNGTDGWLFTFATNALKKISTLSADFTVTIASPAVFSTVAAHGLVAGDAIQLTTTSGSNTTSGVLSLSTTTQMPVPQFGGGVKNVIVSPDNNNVYISLYSFVGNFGGIVIYQYLRDSVTGNISPLSPPNPPYDPGMVGMISAPVFTSDGTLGFVFTSIAVATLLRNSITGVLTYSSNIQYDTNLYYPSVFTPLTIFDDGINTPSLYARVYSTSTHANYILQYSYNRATGTVSALTPLAVSVGTTTTLADAFSSSAVIPVDGKHLYVREYANSKIHFFPRNATTGLLSAVTSISCGTHPLDIARSADNNNIYVITEANGGSLEVYTRNTTTGALTLASTLLCGGATSIAISADDTSVYLGSSGTSIYEYDRNTTTGALTPMSTPVITMANAGSALYVSIAPNGKNVYATGSYNSSINFHDMTIYSRQQSALNVGLPTGLSTLTTYYVLAAGLTATQFEVSLTSGGTAVNTSGVQAGIHTFHTIGNGFPNGAKTVSYIDGRFVVCQPNTQNFYVSNVLAGASWDPLNVQTADSQPDMIVGQITLHNELIVFCEQSGETFYDSGTYPAPFVRNASGIFEVGCIAPYSIAKIDNSVMWLGRSNTGQGVVYRLNGYTPVRLSSYAIEYAIQTMTTISDARAFTYQQEGHHFYVITFPTGNRTFAFDVNTGLWHERAAWNGSVFSKWVAGEYAFFDGKHLVTDTTAGNIFSLSLDTFLDGSNAKKWVRSFRAPPSDMKRVIHNKLTLEAEVGVGQGTSSTTGIVNSIAMSNVGSTTKSLSFTNGTLPATDTAWAVASNGSFYCAVSQNGNTAISTDGVNWTAGSVLTVGTSCPPVISYNGSVFVAVYATATATSSYTSTNGTAWTSHSGSLPVATSFERMGFFKGALYLPLKFSTGSSIYSTTDGINWTLKFTINGTSTPGSCIITDGSTNITWIQANPTAWNVNTSTDGSIWTVNPAIGLGGSTPTGCYGNGKYLAFGLNTAFTSSNGATFTTLTLPVNADWKCAWYDATLGIYYVTASNASTALMSSDGVTWISAYVQSGVGVGINGIASNGQNFCIVPGPSSNVSADAGYVYPAGTYALTFTGGSPTVAATGTYTISATTGQISATAITNTGTGYLTTPAVSFAFGGITGALGSANMTYTTNYNPTGIEPMVSLKYSNDGGHTWSKDGWRDVSLGANGQYAKRVYWYRLGMTTGQTRLYEMSGVSATKIVLIGAYLE